jgi:IS30 family transposase
MKRYYQLTQRQRFIIQDLFELGKNFTEIAKEVEVHRTTISREIKRNSNGKGGYRARGAHQSAKYRQTNIWDSPRKIDGVLEEVIIEKLRLCWSPEQISGRLKLEGKWSISHESIYQWIYKIAPDFRKALRRKSRARRGLKKRRRGLEKRPRKYIEERPEEANIRSEFGHWERDLLEGRRSGPALLVMNDRKSRLTRIKRVFSHQSSEVSEATKSLLMNENKLTITNDNGIEFGGYEKLEKQLGLPVYFCQPYTSWQRGTVENTNGLIRQFYPKHFDFKRISDEEITMLENNLNYRPRKTHGFRTPNEIHFSKKLKLIKERSTYKKQRRQRIFKEELSTWKIFYPELFRALED